MIAFSARTAKAQAHLLKPYNDMDVFVEDVTAKNLYVRLVNRALGKRGHVSSVVAMGSRANVLAACAADQAPRPRRRLYIIDGDLGLLLGESKPRLKHLYRLSVYCSENLLISEAAALQIGTEGHPEATEADVAAKLNLQKRVEAWANAFFGLFQLYAVAHALAVPVVTVNYSAIKLLSDPNDPDALSRKLLLSRMRQVRAAIAAHATKKQYVRGLKKVRKITADKLLVKERFVSGKTYLFPLFQLTLRKHAKCNTNPVALKVRCAAHCDLEYEPGLVRAIRRAIA